jgi:hypothetical protein
MLIRGNYQDGSEGIVEVEGAYAASIWEKALESASKFREGSNTNYCFSEETEADIALVRETTNFDSNLIFTIEW